MELSELTAYAEEKYQIREEHKWADFPGFSVLCHPQTGKWVALLLRQWDAETGTEIERCDLKCGGSPLLMERPYLAPPIRMRGGRWISVAFDGRTEKELVCRLFDRAIRENAPHGAAIVLDSRPGAGGSDYADTPLPFAASGYQPPRERMPERLRELRRMFTYGGASDAARSFYRQAVFMGDYEDDYPWEGGFVSYYPVYQDLTVRQLRGYFGWRTQVRRGVFRPIAPSAAYLYLYELLNGVGADSPEDVLQKLRAVETGFLDSGMGDGRMRANLRRWMLEYAVLNDLPTELARQAADPELTAYDAALAVLREPEAHPDEAIFEALCVFGGKKKKDSPVIARGGARLFGAAWRAACAYRWEDRDLFTLCFGAPCRRRWYPLSNAVYCERSRQGDRDYVLNPCRVYQCRFETWTVTAYEKQSFDRVRLQGFLRETDARLRRYLKTGRNLKEDAADAWAIPYIDAVIEADRRAALEASRPKITIDLNELERIRRDAADTRDSLLVGTESEEAEETAEAAATEAAATEEAAAEEAAEPIPDDLPLDDVQIRLLRVLLRGEDTAAILRAHALMPSIAADFINEALYDEIGDTVLLCEDDRLTLVGDYIEELRQMLGGNGNG